MISVAVFWTAVGLAADFPAHVVRVKDGDTIVVLHEGKRLDVRLEGIDCPESGQAFGQRAKQATSGLAQGKTLRVPPTGTDKYGRTLANITLPDGRNLSQELVRQGYAWWFRKYSTDQTLAKLEAEARQKRIGLWADPNPMPPWD
jgi:micrococcal nuclease